MYQHHTQNHTCLFVCAHSHDTPTCMYTPICTHLCAYTLYTHAHTCTHIPYTCMYTLVHMYVHTQPHTAQVLKSPHEQALSPPFLCGLSSHEICLWSRRRRDEGADQTLFFAQQCPGLRGCGAAGGHRTHVPTAHRGQQGPPSGSSSGRGAPGLLQHSSSCQTSTLLEIQNIQPLFPEDGRGATGPDRRASREAGLPRWGGLFWKHLLPTGELQSTHRRAPSTHNTLGIYSL